MSIVALGGDGFMLETLHRMLGRDVPVYGMNCGSVGFLMNEFSEDDLPARLAQRPGRGAAPAAHARGDRDRARSEEALALNEVSLLRAACARPRRSASPSTAGCGCRS